MPDTRGYRDVGGDRWRRSPCVRRTTTEFVQNEHQISGIGPDIHFHVVDHPNIDMEESWHPTVPATTGVKEHGVKDQRKNLPNLMGTDPRCFGSF
jgi:hypothetical protein